MKRLLSNLLAGLSLLLFMATVALWVRSGFTTTIVDQIYSAGQTAIVVVSRGRVLVYLDPIRVADSGFMLTLRPFNGPSNIKDWIDGGIGLTTDWNFAGFSFWVSSLRGPERAIAVPIWFFSIAFVLWPIANSRLQRTRRFKNARLCVSCGYDLRATPDRCPECGKVPEEVQSIP